MVNAISHDKLSCDTSYLSVGLVYRVKSVQRSHITKITEVKTNVKCNAIHGQEI